MVKGAGEIVGDGAGDLEAPSGLGTGAFPLPLVSRTRNANPGSQISEAGADGPQSCEGEQDFPGWVPPWGRELSAFGFPWRCDFAKGEVLVGCSHTSNSGAAARTQRLKPQAKSFWSSGF